MAHTSPTPETTMGASLNRALHDTSVADPNVPVAEVETAEATVEAPCPLGGPVTELRGAVGAPLISVAPARPSGAGGDPRTTVPSTREAPDSAGGNDAADHSADPGAVLVGYGTGTGARPSRRAARGSGGPPRSTAIDGPSTTSDGPSRVVSPMGGGRPRGAPRTSTR